MILPNSSSWIENHCIEPPGNRRSQGRQSMLRATASCTVAAWLAPVISKIAVPGNCKAASSLSRSESCSNSRSSAPVLKTRKLDCWQPMCWKPSKLKTSSETATETLWSAIIRCTFLANLTIQQLQLWVPSSLDSAGAAASTQWQWTMQWPCWQCARGDAVGPSGHAQYNFKVLLVIVLACARYW